MFIFLVLLIYNSNILSPKLNNILIINYFIRVKISTINEIKRE